MIKSNTRNNLQQFLCDSSHLRREEGDTIIHKYYKTIFLFYYTFVLQNIFFFILLQAKYSMSFSLNKKKQLQGQHNGSIKKAIVIYRQTEKEKQVLRNKINMLQKSYETNRRKQKIIKSQFKKVNKIKQNYLQNREEINELIRKNKQIQNLKKEQIYLKKESQKYKLINIKQNMLRQKSLDYIQVKKKQKNIQEKIKSYRNFVINQKKNSIHKIKSQEQIGHMNRTMFMEIKKKSARFKVQEQTNNILRKNQMNQIKIQQMKMLQDHLLDKLNQSRTSLRSSRGKFNKKLGLTNIRA